MEVTENPTKITTSFNSNKLSRSQIIRTSKQPQKSPSFSPQKLKKIRSLYQDLQHGKLNPSSLRSHLAKIQITPSSKTSKILNDPKPSYTSFIRSLTPSSATESTSQYFTSKQSLFHSSNKRTTPQSSSIRSNLNLQDLNKAVKAYSSGQISQQKFQQSLRKEHIKPSEDLKRNIKQHQQTKSVSYDKLCKSVLGSVNQQKPRFSGTPQQNNIDAFRWINHPPRFKVTPNAAFQAKVEQLKKEQDKICGGMYLAHKRKSKPSVQDNGAILSWKPEFQGCKMKFQAHLQDLYRQHEDIFRWSTPESQVQVTKRANVFARAANNSGNIINWN